MVKIEKHSDFLGPDRHTYRNYNRANGECFRNFIKDNIGLLSSPTCVRNGEKQFRTIVQTAAKRLIPAGRIKNIRPKYPSNAARLARQWDMTKAENPANKRLEPMTSRKKNWGNEHRRTKWLEHLES